MTSEEFVALILAANDELDSDFLAWKVDEICIQWRDEDSGR